MKENKKVSGEVQEEDCCPICFSEFEEMDDLVHMPCSKSHVF
eukprot:CAMPEP_0202978696 /NCGR_PEP_ID=MMETSP1396-20130829/85043_1 /ASSEMBLY_ACC=CAM_ASM_000872 /TAXON_ID= /ORGANISM="Pseudokeronopsis sp., Strain Brazil" /LENGTH=41 /DNA_ID= /DNA_START= /DNA_END= /DNA_ORIENTATION=